MIWALWACLAMLGSDVVSAWLVQAESDGRWWQAGLLDSIAWPLSILVTYTAVTALQGHDFGLKVVVIAAVTGANFGGTSSATYFGRRKKLMTKP